MDTSTKPVRMGIPRLGLDQMDAELAAMLRPRVERLGYLGEFFQCASNSPEPLKHFYRLTESLKKALPDRLTEVVALTVAAQAENNYERVQHERLSLKLGFGEPWVRDVLRRDPNAQTSLSDAERAVQALTLSVLKNYGRGVRVELEAVAAAIGPEQAVAVLILIGRYVTHAQIVNALDLEPPVASPLEQKK
jgi:alkylhydroperoxidase family enzyme